MDADTLEVTPDRWLDTALSLRDERGCDYLDWLGGYDDQPGGFVVVAHAVAMGPPLRHVLLRTRVAREDPRLASVTRVWPGAAWHEREVAEMYGVQFDGHPDPRRLLLSDAVEGFPLRKDFWLQARQDKPWPGAKEPGGREPSPRARRRLRPPGVKDPE